MLWISIGRKYRVEQKEHSRDSYSFTMAQISTQRLRSDAEVDDNRWRRLCTAKMSYQLSIQSIYIQHPFTI